MCWARLGVSLVENRRQAGNPRQTDPAGPNTGRKDRERLHLFVQGLPRIDDVLASRTATIREAAASAGISFQTLNEAIAYAFAPGLTGEAGRDLLAEGIAGYVIGGTPATDAYMQYYMMATVISCAQVRSRVGQTAEARQ